VTASSAIQRAFTQRRRYLTFRAGHCHRCTLLEAALDPELRSEPAKGRDLSIAPLSAIGVKSMAAFRRR
jgi:hypothetical protein